MNEPAEKSRLFLRAARITRRFSPDDVLEMLERAYSADPSSKQAAALYEGTMGEAGKLDQLEAVQFKILGAEENKKTRAKLAHIFGTRWVSRHQNVDTGAKFLEESIKLDPENEGAFHYLRDAYGRKGGDWDRVLTLAEEAVTHAGENSNGNTTFLLAQAGTIAWRQLGNLIRARTVFERLSQIEPHHPMLVAFEAQIGEQLSNAPPPLGGTIPPVAVTIDTTPPPRDFDPARASVPDDGVTAPPPAHVPSEPPVAIVSAPTPAPAPVAATQSVAPAATDAHQNVVGSPDKIAELRALADKQEANKRYNEYVKTLLQLATMVPDAVEQVELYTKAAELYTGKFANQAEAVKAYEAVIAIDPENRGANRLPPRDVREASRLGEAPRSRAARGGAPLRRRARTQVPGDREARHRARQEARGVHRALARGAQQRSLERRSPRRPRRALRALEGLRQARRGPREAGRGHLRQRSEGPDPHEARNDLRRSSEQRRGCRHRVALAARDRSERSQGAGGPQEEVPRPRSLDDLEVFYAETGKWDEFIRVLEQQEAKEANAEAKIGLLFKIAELWADKKQKNDRAARAYEKVLELEPQNLRAAEALIPIYSQAGNAKALANAIEVKLGHEEDAYAKLALLREVAGLYEGKVKDPQKAFARYLAAFLLFPADEQTTVDAERAAKATGEWTQVEAAYRKAIEEATDSGDASLAITLRLKVGRVLVEEMATPGHVDEALSVYREVYDADSENADALAALERLYRATSRYADLLGIYEKRRELSPDHNEKKQISYEIAKLYETEVKDLDKAIDTYNGVLEDEPTDARALAALDVLYQQLERWEPYVDTLRRRIELDTSEPDLIDLKYRLGQTLEKHTGDAAGALENYREILFLDAAHNGAREALEALLVNEDLRAEAASILENIYEERGDWAKLLTALDILSESEGDSDRRVALLRKIARISSEMLTDHTRAFAALSKALIEQPSHTSTRAEIEQISEISTTWKALTELYDQIAESMTDAQLARGYWMRSAQIDDQQLGLVDEAAKGYTHVLSLDPGDIEALDALEMLFSRTQRWTDLITVIERRIEQTADPERREALYGQMASIYDQQLGRPDDAVTSYKRVLELDPASTTALAALDALFTRQQMWSDLAENLESQLSLATEDEAQVALMLRLASLRETKMSQVEQAIDGYRTVLERDVSNAERRSARSSASVRSRRTSSSSPTLLEPLYPPDRRLPEAHRRARSPGSPRRRRARKVELLHQISQLHEDAASDHGSAFLTLARALKADPSSEGHADPDRPRRRATGRFADLATVYQELGAEQEDAELASALTMMSARVYEADIGDVDTGDLPLSQGPRARRAPSRGCRVARAALQADEPLRGSLSSSSSARPTSSTSRPTRRTRSSGRGHRGGRPRASRRGDRRLQQGPRHRRGRPPCARRAHQALPRSVRWADLLAVYSKKADLVADPEEKKRIYYQVGAVYERELGRRPAGHRDVHQDPRARSR